MLTFIVVVALGLGLLYIGYRMSLRAEIRRGAHESGERGDIFRDYEKSTGNTHISF